MAIPMTKATYTLDSEAVRTLENLARRWGVSKSEALRRAIAAAGGSAAADRVAVLDRLQAAAGLAPAAANRWSNDVRAERRAGDRLSRHPAGRAARVAEPAPRRRK